MNKKGFVWFPILALVALVGLMFPTVKYITDSNVSFDIRNWAKTGNCLDLGKKACLINNSCDWVSAGTKNCTSLSDLKCQSESSCVFTPSKSGNCEDLDDNICDTTNGCTFNPNFEEEVCEIETVIKTKNCLPSDCDSEKNKDCVWEGENKPAQCLCPEGPQNWSKSICARRYVCRWQEGSSATCTGVYQEKEEERVCHNEVVGRCEGGSYSIESKCVGSYEGGYCKEEKMKNENPTITDYWKGKAEFKFIQEIVQDNSLWPAGFEGSAHVEVVGDTWYLFHRKVNWDSKPSYCSISMNLVVQSSTDNGISWSNPVDVIDNTRGTPWECAATDGDVYYNSEENKWHYLFQCLGRSGAWKGCHAIRDGVSPFGSFTPTPDNPVINGGEIWDMICDLPTDDCSVFSKKSPLRKVLDEGTFDIFDYKDGFYFVSFHGFDGVNGYRGIAKTMNFQNWEVVAPDSVLDKNDALDFDVDWDENGPIGFGAGGIIKDRNYYYLISEGADKSLLCQDGQNWVWGLFRTSNITSTDWAQFPKKNPFFTVMDFPNQDPNSLPCFPAYVGIFISNGKTYLHASRPSYDPKFNGIYFYELIFDKVSPSPETPDTPDKVSPSPETPDTSENSNQEEGCSQMKEKYCLKLGQTCIKDVSGEYCVEEKTEKECAPGQSICVSNYKYIYCTMDGVWSEEKLCPNSVCDSATGKCSVDDGGVSNCTTLNDLFCFLKGSYCVKDSTGEHCEETSDSLN
ncbi:MAG: hypothetical protein U9Q63_00055 [Patescibacteria group bacterium]|nr:hypothetical protein [Patescibacteria group bacterium]